MNNKVVEVQVRAVIPWQGSFALFLGNAEKTFVIYVEESVGTAISMFMRHTAKERPLTHDLLANVLLAFGAKVERIIINHINGPIFHARLIIAAENEIHARKVIELDARPSDCIALATHQGAPIFVAQKVWESVEDVSDKLDLIETQSIGSDSLADDDDSEEEEEDDDDDDDLDDINIEDLLFGEEDEEDDEEDEDADSGSLGPPIR